MREWINLVVENAFWTKRVSDWLEQVGDEYGPSLLRSVEYAEWSVPVGTMLFKGGGDDDNWYIEPSALGDFIGNVQLRRYQTTRSLKLLRCPRNAEITQRIVAILDSGDITHDDIARQLAHLGFDGWVDEESKEINLYGKDGVIEHPVVDTAEE